MRDALKKKGEPWLRTPVVLGATNVDLVVDPKAGAGALAVRMPCD
jgi:hypothetical protein